MDDSYASLRTLIGRSFPVNEVAKGQYSVEGFTLRGTGLYSNLSLRDTHFSKCTLQNMCLFNCKLQSCTFDACLLCDSGLWDSVVENCHFIRCDMRRMAFGGVNFDKPNPNIYRANIFKKCRLAPSYHTCEIYEDCIFENCKLDGVNFDGAVFQRCKFTGKISNVSFSAACAVAPNGRVNRMAQCDFSESTMREFLFRNIDLTDTVFGDDKRLLFLAHGRTSMQMWLDNHGSTFTPGQKWFVEYIQKDLANNTVLDKDWLLSVFDEGQIAALVNLDGTQ